ncbi:selenocysteine lyase/cysteine desulfurase [Sphingomonas vulcanisoli]|uniref:Selenocysteine lyase/cysteine desulfurase n=1 Tax=Sphingomonas vulcanisoli TaxID=1658060 RepID=A0ABX0TRT6_9SPHN|nr:aminotransferase class V-fold PLP-dependent enzyme [Sphingomonas vulcanisoli]NIJ06505.1 selenocysteine lyase/cysteine desulfurase [Sphingomonas vulcanisoli]
MTLTPNRRQLLGAAAATPALLSSAALADPLAPAPAPKLAPNSIPIADLAAQFDVEREIHNLEAGYWGVMPRVVAETYVRHTLEVNRLNSVFARNVLPGDGCMANGTRDAQASVARMVGCLPQEIAITRSGSDALQQLITNYKPLKAGDAVIYCDLDYDAMIGAMEWLGSHRGAKVVRFAMPEPATTANILAAYEDVLRRTPEAKLLLVTQISNRTGLITPVKEIVAMARARGVDTIVDASHAVALLDVTMDDLGCDFAGWSVHKWTCAPLGTGAMYIRKNRLADIAIAYDNNHVPADNINAREPAGTVNFAALLTIPTAVDFHYAVGASAAKAPHMRALRNRWVDQVRDLPNVEIMVPDDPARSCTITSFRLKGMTTPEKAQAVQKRLFEKHKVLTVWRDGVARAPVIRATPGFYSRPEDADALAAALRAEHAMLI